MEAKGIKEVLDDLRNITVTVKTEEGIKTISPVVKTEYAEADGKPQLHITLDKAYAEYLTITTE